MAAPAVSVTGLFYKSRGVQDACSGLSPGDVLPASAATSERTCMELIMVYGYPGVVTAVDFSGMTEFKERTLILLVFIITIISHSGFPHYFFCTI